MRRAVYLDFSTPLYESESNLNSFFLTLSDISKTIHRSRNTKFYVSITLDFITFSKDKSAELIQTLKELAESDRVQFVVKDNFDVCSPVLDGGVFEFNSILNEYLLGYLFGSKKNFEGDPSIMIRNLVNYFPYDGKVTLDTLKEAENFGYKNILIDSNCLSGGSFVFSGVSFTKLDLAFGEVFRDFITKDRLDSFLKKDLATDYQTYYLNLYNCYSENPAEFLINLSNVIHLLDLSEFVDYKFADESFEMPVEKDLKSVSISTISDLSARNYNSEKLLSIQKDLSSFIKLDRTTQIDGLELDDFKTIPLWESTTSEEVNSYLKYCFIILSLLSRSVDTKLYLLGSQVKPQLTSFLKELENYSDNEKDLKRVLDTYSSFINHN
jgi:hypothetical protein